MCDLNSSDSFVKVTDFTGSTFDWYFPNKDDFSLGAVDTVPGYELQTDAESLDPDLRVLLLQRFLHCGWPIIRCPRDYSRTMDVEAALRINRDAKSYEIKYSFRFGIKPNCGDAALFMSKGQVHDYIFDLLILGSKIASDQLNLVSTPFFSMLYDLLSVNVFVLVATTGSDTALEPDNQFMQI